MRLLLILLALLGYCSGQVWYNQTIACNHCGKQVYHWLRDDPENLVGGMGMRYQLSSCPTFYPFLENDFCHTQLTRLFAFFYRPLHSMLYPYRDQICRGLCGHSGANYTFDY